MTCLGLVIFVSIFLDGMLGLDWDIGISLVEIRNRISGEQRQASIKGPPEPLASKGIIGEFYLEVAVPFRTLQCIYPKMDPVIIERAPIKVRSPIFNEIPPIRD